jgi:hypothetical protein
VDTEDARAKPVKTRCMGADLRARTLADTWVGPSFAKTTAPLFGGHRDCFESWSPDDRDPIGGGTRLAGLRTLARTSAALDGPSRRRRALGQAARRS